MTKVLFIDDGIDFDAETARQKPIGGAETAFVSLVEELAKLNIEVVVYNNCLNQGIVNNVTWKKLDRNILNEKFDCLVVNRGDKFLNFKKDCKKRFFWIHNPAKYLLKFRYLSKLFFNDFKIIFSSNYHKNTYPFWAPGGKIVIPYGVSTNIKVRKKTQPPPSSAIFTSNPLRELDWLLDRWRLEIYPSNKNLKLNIYSGSLTYGKFGKKHFKNSEIILKKAKRLKSFGINVFSPLKRNELFNKIKESRVFLYKGTKDETFCMSAAEAQVLGVPCVVCNYGSMQERVRNNQTGFVCQDDKEFVKKTIKLLNDDDIWMKMHSNLIKNNNHLKWSKVAKIWQKILK